LSRVISYLSQKSLSIPFNAAYKGEFSSTTRHS
jgi:hypothetical protein